MDFKNQPVLVTGAAGWLGRNLVQGLVELKAARVRGLLLPHDDEAALRKIHSGVEILRGDVTSAEDCRALCDNAAGGILFHCAGMIHPRRISEFYSVNVDGTRNILNAAALAGVSRAVVVSSNSPFGTNPHPDHVFDEESPYHPYMNYGRSKMLMERAAMELCRRGDLEVVLARVPWFYGPHQPPRQTLFFRMIRDGKAPIVGDGSNRRSMAYVENTVQGLALCATSTKASGQAYWLADARPYPMTEIIDTIERLLEKEFAQKCTHRRLRLPSIASEVALVVDAALQRVGVYQQKIHVLSEMNKTIACSIEKARAELGYRPLVDLEEGMRRSLAWCLANGQSL